MSKHDIGAKIKLDGEAEYRKQISNITAQQKLLQAQMKQTAASFTENTTATQKNASISKVLSEQVKVQRARVDELRGMVEKASGAYQEGDTELIRWQTQLVSAETKLKSLEKAEADAKDGILLMREELQASGKEIERFDAKEGRLKAELDKTTSAYDKNTSAAKKNENLSKSLTQRIQNQKERVDMLRGAVEKASKAYPEGAVELEKWKTKLANAEAELQRLQTELKNVPNSIQTMGQAMQNAGKKISGFGDKMARVGSTLTKTLTVPILGGFTAATKASLSFEDGMAKVYTIADRSVKPISEMSDEILALSNRTGKGAGELAEAAYQALSASVDTENAVEFVSTAADLAKAGFLETAGAVDVLTTIINAYDYSAKDAQKIADQLIQTQNDGKTTVDQLAQSMGQVIPTAAALNIPLEQLNAAYAVMTKQGINTANTTTYLNGLFTELADGGSDVAKVLQAQTGQTFGQLMAAGYSLGDVLGILSDTVNGNSEDFLNLWGNVRAGRGALSIVNGGITEFNTETKAMQDATGNVATALETLGTKGAAARRALNQITNAGVEIGDRFAPYVEKAATVVSDLLAKWDALDPAAQNAIIKAAAIAAAVGPVVTIASKLTAGVAGLVTGVGGILTVTGPVLAAVAPAIPLIAGIAAGVTGLILVIKNWDTIVEGAGKIWTMVTTDIKTAATDLKNNITETGTNIATGISTKVGQIRSGISTGLGNASAIVTNKMAAIQETFTQKIDAARAAVAAGIERIKGLFNFSWSLPQIRLPHFSWNWESVGGLISLPRIHVDWYKKAYENPMLFNGPTVLPTLSGFKGFGDGNGGEVVIGKNTMYAMIRDAVAEGRGNSSYTYGDINVSVYGAQTQDDESLADRIASRIYQEIVQREAAWG